MPDKYPVKAAVLGFSIPAPAYYIEASSKAYRAPGGGHKMLGLVVVAPTVGRGRGGEVVMVAAKYPVRPEKSTLQRGQRRRRRRGRP